MELFSQLPKGNLHMATFKVRRKLAQVTPVATSTPTFYQDGKHGFHFFKLFLLKRYTTFEQQLIKVLWQAA